MSGWIPKLLTSLSSGSATAGQVPIADGSKGIAWGDQSGGGGTGGIDDPTDLSNLVLWLDATQIAGLSDGDPVSTWADASGNGNDFTSSSTNRPTWQTNELNGLAAVRFDGSNDYLGAGSALIPSDGDFALYIVFRSTFEATYGALLSQYAAAQAGRTIITTNQNSAGTNTAGLLNPFINGITNGSSASGPGLFESARYTNPCLFSMVNQGGTRGAQWFLNSRRVDEATLSTVYTGVSTGLGRDIAGALQAFDGDVFEVILYDPSHGNYRRRQVEDYLYAKWAI